MRPPELVHHLLHHVVAVGTVAEVDVTHLMRDPNVGVYLIQEIHLTNKYMLRPNNYNWIIIFLLFCKMTRSDLFSQIKKKSSYLCVGLDTDINKIPRHLLDHKDPVFEFNKQIIDATHDLCIAYKPNVAFYEALGPKGWESLQKTVEYIPKECFTIADAKRGDIGNTSSLYAKAFFKEMNFDSITVAPYMGEDSVTPFLEFKGKWVILLAHTSNAGSGDFQLLRSSTGKPVVRRRYYSFAKVGYGREHDVRSWRYTSR